MGKGKNTDKGAAGTTAETTPPAAAAAAPAAPAASSTVIPAEASASISNAWTTYIIPFAQAISKTSDEVTNALKPLVGDPSDNAIALLQSEEDTPNSDVTDALKGLGVPKAVLNKSIKMLRKAAPAAAGTPAMSTFVNSVLPTVPDDGSFTEMLRTGGTLNVDHLAVMSGLRATLAEAKGIYQLPKVISVRMEQFAENELQGPVSEKVYEFLDMLAARDYAEVLRVIKVSSRFITEARKNSFLKKTPLVLSALQRFHEQLQAYANTANQGGMMGSNALIQVAQALVSGNKASLAFMNTMPSTLPLRTAAEAVNDKINQAYAGFGVPASRALAYEAGKIKTLLMDPALPALLGYANRDMMLKQLGVGVSSDYPLLENNVVQYALGVINLPGVPSGDTEITYLSALYQLGQAIQWEQLQQKPASSSRL